MVMLGLEVYGESAIERQLLRFSANVLDAAPAFEVIAQMFWASEEKQFMSEGAWGASGGAHAGAVSGGWAPLADATVEAKVRAGMDPTILRATSTLYDSLTGGPGSVKQISPDHMVVGSQDPIGAFHQRGHDIPTPLPMRKPVELPERVKVAMIKTLQRWIVTGAL
jgi:hypothetical protein